MSDCLLEKGKNRKIKNKNFTSKKLEYITSDFVDAQEISLLDAWKETNIRDRAKKIADSAVNIWSL